MDIYFNLCDSEIYEFWNQFLKFASSYFNKKNPDIFQFATSVMINDSLAPHDQTHHQRFINEYGNNSEVI